MRVIILLLSLCPFLLAGNIQAAVEPSAPVSASVSAASTSASNIVQLLDRAMSMNLIAGGVVVVGNHEGILATAARGQVSPVSGAAPISDRTVFDVASLTKVVATTPAVIKLLDEGRINLSDPISRWFPEFAGTGRGEITVLHLMTHTSGLADVMVGADRSIETVSRKAAAQNRRQGAGTSFDYADINFILLGELVHRVTGETLDQYCREQVYEPLGTRETLFLPRNLSADIAPTSGDRGGVVQDDNARKLGGVAGHAGLFSSAYDLSRYARLLLGRGTLDGKRIFSEQVMAQMTTPYLCSNGRVKRGLGWDMTSPYSAPKGNFFSDTSFGHTGYSGSSIWIDPEQDLFVIMLTRRTDYRNVHNFNQLRKDVSTFAAADFRPGMNQLAEAELNRLKSQPVPVQTAAAQAPARRTKVASLKWQPERRGAKCSVKSERRVAKARGIHRAGRTTRVAKSDAVKSYGKKRRTLPKS